MADCTEEKGKKVLPSFFMGLSPLNSRKLTCPIEPKIGPQMQLAIAVIASAKKKLLTLLEEDFPPLKK